jgi:hypothetical protein
MSLDRALQLEILEKLAAEYPAAVSDIHNKLSSDAQLAIKNIHYLAAHGLISANFSSALGQRIPVPGPVKITHHGMDFLADDGGLSAILGVVTVKLHEDTLRQLITSKIQASDLPAEEKNSLLQTVKELPGEAIKHLSEKLLDLGLENAPRAVSLIHKALQYVQS